MGDDLEARLKSHARAFEGLMSLIPAKEYYGKDESITSNQWRAKKQTTEERQAAKRAKLDPANHKSAKDVMDENARKRKRELEGDDASDVDIDVEREKPGEGMKAPLSKAKKQKTSAETDGALSSKQAKAESEKEAKAAKAKAREDRKKRQAEQKKEKKAQKQQKLQARKTSQEEFSKALNDPKESDAEDDEVYEGAEQHDVDGIESLDVSGLVEESQSTTTASAAASNASTASIVSAASSSSSIPPPSEARKPEKRPWSNDQKNHDAFRARLTAKLEAMRKARKADGVDGRPAKNRAELIEARRNREAERKAARKAQKQLVKEDEERLKAEEQLARIRGGSGSPSIYSHRSSPDRERNLSFGRVAWQDGQQLEGDLGGFLDSKKKKGRSDAKTALEAAKNKQSRLNALDEEKRKDIQEKDLWLSAKKRAQGERVHDNPTLLKKTVKRLEKAKAKSGREWKDREDNVQKSKAAKQKRREENLKKRREEKGAKGKKKVKKPGKKVRRPGFEGAFKSK